MESIQPAIQAEGEGQSLPEADQQDRQGEGRATPSLADGARHLPTWGWIYNRVDERRSRCEDRAFTHDKRALLWQRVATPLSLLTAILAGISGLSVVADSQGIAVVFSVATALVAATNATLKPSDTAKSHRAAATSYERLKLKMDDFMTFDLDSDYDAEPPVDALPPILKRIQEFDAELNGIEDSQPPLTASKSLVRLYKKPQPLTFELRPEVVVSGESFVASFANGPGNASDWVGIYKAGENPDTLKARFWQYAGGGQNLTQRVVAKGSLTFSTEEPWEGSVPPPEGWWPPEPGDYVAYFFESGQRSLTTANFKVADRGKQLAPR